MLAERAVHCSTIPLSPTMSPSRSLCARRGQHPGEINAPGPAAGEHGSLVFSTNICNSEDLRRRCLPPCLRCRSRGERLRLGSKSFRPASIYRARAGAEELVHIRASLAGPIPYLPFSVLRALASRSSQARGGSGICDSGRCYPCFDRRFTGLA